MQPQQASKDVLSPILSDTAIPLFLYMQQLLRYENMDKNRYQKAPLAKSYNMMIQQPQ